jgi:two-component system response regulator
MSEEHSSDHPSTLVSRSAPIFEKYLRVLHINDSTDDQVLFQAACRKGKVPFNWHVADSAEKGISYLKTLLEQSKHVPVCWPDLILLDIVMPQVSGFEVLKFIRSTRALDKLPVAVFTGHTIPSHKEESLSLGADLFLLKPTDFQEAVQLAMDLYLKIGGCKKDSSAGIGSEHLG